MIPCEYMVFSARREALVGEMSRESFGLEIFISQRGLATVDWEELTGGIGSPILD